MALSIEAVEGERGAGSAVGVVAGAAEEVGEVVRAGAAAGVAALPHAPRSVTTPTQPRIEMSLLIAPRSVVTTGLSRSQSGPGGDLAVNQPSAPNRRLWMLRDPRRVQVGNRLGQLEGIGAGGSAGGGGGRDVPLAARYPSFRKPAQPSPSYSSSVTMARLLNKPPGLDIARNHRRQSAGRGASGFQADGIPHIGLLAGFKKIGGQTPWASFCLRASL